MRRKTHALRRCFTIVPGAVGERQAMYVWARYENLSRREGANDGLSVNQFDLRYCGRERVVVRDLDGISAIAAAISKTPGPTGANQRSNLCLEDVQVFLDVFVQYSYRKKTKNGRAILGRTLIEWPPFLRLTSN